MLVKTSGVSRLAEISRNVSNAPALINQNERQQRARRNSSNLEDQQHLRTNRRRDSAVESQQQRIAKHRDNIAHDQQQHRVSKSYDSAIAGRRQSQTIVEQDEVFSRERHEYARFEADLLAKQLFEMKVRDSLAAERLAAKVAMAELDIDKIKPKAADTPSVRLSRQIEELMALQNDTPLRNEPVFVNVQI